MCNFKKYLKNASTKYVMIIYRRSNWSIWIRIEERMRYVNPMEATNLNSMNMFVKTRINRKWKWRSLNLNYKNGINFIISHNQVNEGSDHWTVKSITKWVKRRKRLRLTPIKFYPENISNCNKMWGQNLRNGPEQTTNERWNFQMYTQTP